jgi:hypothetical protein
MLTESLFAIMARHRFESIPKHGTLLNLLPIMQHMPVLNGALDLLASPGNDFFVVCGDGLCQGCLVGANALKDIKEMGNVADAVVETLTAV